MEGEVKLCACVAAMHWSNRAELFKHRVLTLEMIDGLQINSEKLPTIAECKAHFEHAKTAAAAWSELAKGV